MLSEYRRIAGSPIQSTYDLLHEFYEAVPEDRVEGIRVTGSGSRTIAKVLGLFFENEFKAIARMIGALLPAGRARSSRSAAKAPSTSAWRAAASWITTAPANAPPAPDRSSTSRRCACSIRWKKWAAWCHGARCAARIAGRCSVFAKSDMIHAQQKGYSPAEILRGLCDAVARNFKSSIVKGRPVEAPVALIGAVSQNAGVTGALREAFALSEGDLLVPEQYAWCGAIGTAMLEAEEPRKRSILEIHRLRQHDAEDAGAGHQSALHRERGAAARPRWRLCARPPRPVRSPRIWAWTSARSPPTWWSSTSSAR